MFKTIRTLFLTCILATNLIAGSSDLAQAQPDLMSYYQPYSIANAVYNPVPTLSAGDLTGLMGRSIGDIIYNRTRAGAPSNRMFTHIFLPSRAEIFKIGQKGPSTDVVFTPTSTRNLIFAGGPLAAAYRLGNITAVAAYQNGNFSITPAGDYVSVFDADQGGNRYRYTLGIRFTDVGGIPPLAGPIASQELINQPPTANAGADQTVASAATVTLDGAGSRDSDVGQTLTYAWTAPAAVTLSDATAASPTFTAPTLAAGDPDQTLTFYLTVTDNLDLASAADTVTITVISGPTVSLSGGPEAITSTDPFTVTATFSKPVTGFDQLASDVVVTNGSVTASAGGPAIYTLTITPTGNGDVSIKVPVAAAQDAVGNPNSASNTLVIGNRIVEITQDQIAGFMLVRANNLASFQPGLTRFLQGEGCWTFNANATEGAGSINGCVSNGNAWSEITSAWSGISSYTLGTLGTHTFVNPNLLIGGMVQFDYTDDQANNASGRGWMVGPYFVAKAPEQLIYFEGRLLYGQTENEITPIDTYTDSFETERWLAQLRATGEYRVQNTTLMPRLDFTYTEDSQHIYTDSLGNTIPGQTVSLMQLGTGLDFSQPLPISTGTLILTGGISGIYSSSDGTPEFENWRWRTHLGLNYDTGTGATLNLAGFYDGLGTNYESYGANFGLDWRF